MSQIATRDGAEIYYKDWGSGPPVVFCHGWPLNADAWESQMNFLASNGYRCVAHDRRGHGRSSQPWHGNEMDTYADDLSELIDTLDLRGATHIGHSTGGGEIARYIGRYSTRRVARAVLVGAVTPLMLKTAANPGGLPIEAFDTHHARDPEDLPGWPARSRRHAQKRTQCRPARLSEGLMCGAPDLQATEIGPAQLNSRPLDLRLEQEEQGHVTHR